MFGTWLSAGGRKNHSWPDELLEIRVATTLLSAQSCCGTRLHWSLEALWRLEAVQREHEGLPPLVDLGLGGPELCKSFLDFVKSLLMS